MSSGTQITKKQDLENTKILEKQSFEQMQDLLYNVARRGSSNMEFFNMAKDYLRENLNATKQQKQESFNFVIKNLPPEAKKELVGELKREKETKEIKIVQPTQQNEQKDVNKYIIDKLGKDEKLAPVEISQLEKHLEERGKSAEKKLNAVISKYENIRDELILKVDILLEKYENKTATIEEKKNLVVSVGLLQEVHTIINTVNLEKAGEITGSSKTKGSAGLKFSFIGSQFENAVYRTFIDAQKSLEDTITSLENVSSDMEKLTKGLNSNKDISNLIPSYEKNNISLERNINSLLSSIDNLKYQEGVAEGAYGEVRNFAIQSVGAVASLGVSTVFSTYSVSSMLLSKGLVKGVEVGADYVVGATSTYYGTGKFDLEDATKQVAASASSLLGLKGVKGTHIKQIATNASKVAARVYSNVAASTINTEMDIQNPVRVMGAD